MIALLHLMAVCYQAHLQRLLGTNVESVGFNTLAGLGFVGIGHRAQPEAKRRVLARDQRPNRINTRSLTQSHADTDAAHASRLGILTPLR